MSNPSRVKVTGPLEQHAPGFWEELAERGYSPHTATELLYLLGHLSRWLGERGLDCQDLTPDQAGCFLADRIAAGYAHHLTPRGLQPLLGYLGRAGVLPQPVTLAAEPAGVLVAEFRVHLLRERGLAVRTAHKYTWIAARFLAQRGTAARASELAGLSLGELDAFVLAESGRLGSRSLCGVVTGLRALLRFLALKGLAAPGLAEALPSGPAWRRSSHGRVLDREEIVRLLAGCDRRRAAGRRDYAMLVLMVRLGLRANEVATLRLEDVDWRAGEILVSGKGGRDERLPLPVDVGRALADYCRHG
jgi:integrase/recombinase XerD